MLPRGRIKPAFLALILPAILGYVLAHATLPAGFNSGGHLVPNATDGSNLVSLNASQLTSGTVPTGRLPTLPKANGAFGQDVSTGLAPGAIAYVDASGVLQIGNPPAVHDVVISSNATSTEQALFPGPSETGNLSAVNGVAVNPYIKASSAGTVFNLVAGLDSNVVVSDALVLKVRKSTNQGSSWSDLLTVTIAAGASSGSDASVGSFAKGDWIQATSTASTGTNYYSGGLRFQLRYN